MSEPRPPGAQPGVEHQGEVDVQAPAGMPTAASDGAAPRAGDEEGWQRLSPRMLLVHPLLTLRSMIIPIVLVLFSLMRGDGLGDGGGVWFWIALAFPVIAVVFGVLSWHFTRYRFTPQQLQLRSGWLNRKLVTAPLDRIRSVDLESSLLHRVLGLTKAQIGTGVDTSQITLDGLPREHAARLRVDLLARSHLADDAVAEAPPAQDAPTGEPERSLPAPEEELARIDWGWLRYAPFSLSSLVVVAGALGVLGQFGDDVPIDEVSVASDAWEWVVAQAVLLLVAGALLVLVVSWLLVSTLSYVITWWNLRLVREAGGKIRLTRGLFTTKSQTIEGGKIRGVLMTEQFLLRFVKGAELTALATGVGTGGTAKLLPPAPRRVVQEVGHAILEEEGPLTMPLVGHGPRARRRIHVRRQWGTLFLVGLACIPTFVLDVWIFGLLPWWGPLAVLLVVGVLNVLIAESAWRNLGHGLTDEHVVVQTGAVIRSREVLERAGIIGWTLDQSFFQRRLGLGDLTATTAAGNERLLAPNIPVPLAVDLADRASPGMLDGFRA
ncbi:transmembrane protein, distant y with ydbT [Serinicoccus hydrothermalis]|uniref:Transmembrane protein, distant y with ydbT n=1 Tax=Serinicoccus hydrothermalis TaxID=1758689 RepID=A0A1B1NBG7_9MICO|nr:PH domain-containing protein [Serinicoccus hydrothermalis]ANS78767.1 transmembrane protein, distant y with ydbT [Serinicoccus hydrothermalis]